MPMIQSVTRGQGMIMKKSLGTLHCLYLPKRKARCIEAALISWLQSLTICGTNGGTREDEPELIYCSTIK